MSKPTINKELLPMKAHFFFFNGATAPVVPFMPTYARQLGFSSFTVGTIYTVLPITGLLAKPFFGALADRFRLQKALFMIFQAITAIAFFSIMFIPETETVSNTSLSCGLGEAFFETCSHNSTLDSCAAAKVIAQTGGNTTITCQMKCTLANVSMWTTVCENWHAPQFCNQAHEANDILEFTANVPMDKVLQLEDCLFFKVESVVFSDGAQKFPSCPVGKSITSTCDTVCDSPVVNELIVTPKHADSAVSGQFQFWLLFLFLAISWIGMAVVVSVGDAICFEMLGTEPNKYGHQRLFGSLGWGTFSILAGVLVDYFSHGEVKKNYTSVFYLMLVLIALDLFTSSKLKYQQTKLSVNIFRDVSKLLSEAKIVVFMFWCVSIGLFTGLIWQFLFWHLENLASQSNCSMMDSIKTLEGLVMGIQCFGGELPFFFLSGYILKKVGHINAMHLVLLGFGVRCLLYSLLTNPWLCLPIELLHGITFGVFYATMASYASIVAPPGTEATIQGLVGAIFEGVGVSLGSLIGGLMFDSLGGAMTFRIYGIAALVLFLLHIAVQHFIIAKPTYSVSQGTDFDSTARYAAPGDAIHMIDEHPDSHPFYAD